MMDEKQFDQEMQAVRRDIDRIDKALTPLLTERMLCSERVADIKRQAGKPVLDASREQAILSRIRESSPEFGGSLVPVFRSIMAVSRIRQHGKMHGTDEIRQWVQQAPTALPVQGARVLCQGVPGAYTHRAARHFFPDHDIAFIATWNEVFEAVAEDRADYGVLPVENSAAGAVSDVYTLLMEYRFYIVGAATEKISHCIAAARDHGEIKKVVSHPQGLMQCTEYIKAHDLETQEYSNTAAAAKYVAESGPADTAAICSLEAAKEYGLSVLEQNIQNTKQNATRFIIIAKNPVLPEDADKISLCFSLPHEAGSLYQILERFAVHGLNLTKIESRPIPERNFEYDFYLDFTGNLHDEETSALIGTLQQELPHFSFLGNYRERQ